MKYSLEDFRKSCSNISSVQSIYNNVRKVLFAELTPSEFNLLYESVANSPERPNLASIDYTLMSIYQNLCITQQHLTLALDAFPTDFWSKNDDIQLIDNTSHHYLSAIVGDYIRRSGKNIDCISKVYHRSKSIQVLNEASIIDSSIFRSESSELINIPISSYDEPISTNGKPTVYLYKLSVNDDLNCIVRDINNDKGYKLYLIMADYTQCEDLAAITSRIQGKTLFATKSRATGSIILIEKVDYSNFEDNSPIIVPFRRTFEDTYYLNLYNRNTGTHGKYMYPYVDFIDNTFYHSGSCIIYSSRNIINHRNSYTVSSFLKESAKSWEKVSGNYWYYKAIIISGPVPEEDMIRYDMLRFLDFNRIIAVKESKFGVITDENEIIVPFNYDSINSVIINGVEHIICFTNGHSSLFNLETQSLIYEFDGEASYSDNLDAFLVKMADGEQYICPKDFSFLSQIPKSVGKAVSLKGHILVFEDTKYLKEGTTFGNGYTMYSAGDIETMYIFYNLQSQNLLTTVKFSNYHFLKSTYALCLKDKTYYLLNLKNGSITEYISPIDGGPTLHTFEDYIFAIKYKSDESVEFSIINTEVEDDTITSNVVTTLDAANGWRSEFKYRILHNKFIQFGTYNGKYDTYSWGLIYNLEGNEIDTEWYNQKYGCQKSTLPVKDVSEYRNGLEDIQKQFNDDSISRISHCGIYFYSGYDYDPEFGGPIRLFYGENDILYLNTFNQPAKDNK